MTDYISRADAIEAVYEYFPEIRTREQVQIIFEALPSAETHEIRTETHGVCSDLISRADAIDALSRSSVYAWSTEQDLVAHSWAIRILQSLPSAEVEKKKAELKDNGDWDCPDVGCDECDHHRSVEWCSLAIPNHEKEIDETYKMVNEAFFEGFNAAEKRYRFLIEYVEELDRESAEAVQGEWIMHGEPPWYVRECSKCGTKWHQWSGDSNPNYCGNCGARMKGGDDE